MVTRNHFHLAFVRMLVDIKRASQRRRVWFTLSRVERNHIKSSKLAKVLTATIEKWQKAMDIMANRLVVRTVGLSLSRKISRITVGCGTYSAYIWAEDFGQAKFVALYITRFKGKV